MKHIGLVPLDSRPCNTTFIEHLCQTANAKLVSFPRELSGRLFKGASIHKIDDWVLANYMELDYLILSSDALVFGGLVQSRSGVYEAKRLDDIKTILQIMKLNKPSLQIYVFDTIMRTSISTTDKETAKYWKMMNQFSFHQGRYLHTKDEESLTIYQDLEKAIPKHIFETYYHARKQKHQMNVFFVEAVKEKLVDYLILLQEDSSIYGVQKQEQAILHELIETNLLSQKIRIYNGTDEGAATLLSRALLYKEEIRPKLYVLVPKPNILKQVMAFEDHPFEHNVKEMVEASHMVLTADAKDADMILAIYVEELDNEMHLEEDQEIYDPNKNHPYQYFTTQINYYHTIGKPVALADIFMPNGGSFPLLQAINYKKLKGYSAWNTASNTLGTLLGQIASYLIGKTNNPNVEYDNDLFTLERILDDSMFQTIVRKEINQHANQRNINIYALGDAGKQYEVMLKKRMKELTASITSIDYDVVFPWNRTFEAQVILKPKKGQQIYE